ncbi:MAG: 30S ribosomal protein S16 [Rhodospirillales bacterium]|nr:MAG: 30S ribosomal protein S16 [Rhodospirillales bacterium]
MAVTIRLSRAGAKKRPHYRIVVADSRSPRDGRFIEKLGTYDPLLPQGHAERLKFDAERVQHWLKNGVVVSDRCQRFFAAAGLMAKPAIHSQTKKDKPKAKAIERMKMEAEAAAKAAEAAAAPAAEA